MRQERKQTACETLWNIVPLHGHTNKHLEDLAELQLKLEETENWTSERLHLVFLCCEMMNHKNLPTKVKEKAYELVLTYACAADAIYQYNTEKMEDIVPVNHLGESK